MVHLAGASRLAASAGPFAVPAGPQTDGLADVGRDALAVADVQRQARPGQPRVELLAAQEAGQPARTRQQLDRLADDRLYQRIPGPAGTGSSRTQNARGLRRGAAVTRLVIAWRSLPGTVAEPAE